MAKRTNSLTFKKRPILLHYGKTSTACSAPGRHEAVPQIQITISSVIKKYLKSSGKNASGDIKP